MIPLVLLFAGWPFLTSTLSYTSPGASKPSTIRILSFNTKLFRQSKTYSKFSTELIDWVAMDTSGIKCIQEYSTNARWPDLDVTSKIKNQGYKAYTFQADLADTEHDLGMAIFSKYNLLDSGIVFQDRLTLNAAIFVDLQIEDKIIRIYNIHLASMFIDLSQVNQLGEVKSLVGRLTRGAIKRTDQINTLIAHTKTSPHPFILCGDFNETPYGQGYLQLSREYKNAFEEAGRGFGFTFNELPYLLRIDHQFYGSNIKAVNYSIDRNIKISDHYPTFGEYLIE